ncbi:MAG: hypothetical protein H0W34_09365 [Pyrinomonadaceae bacterium]|nr:hypothetical protein [Pyrinomonadaceae bacterium]
MVRCRISELDANNRILASLFVTGALNGLERADVRCRDELTTEVVRPIASKGAFELTQVKCRASDAVTPLAELH